MATAEIWHGMFPFDPGVFFELNPLYTPITNLISQKGIVTTPNKLYTQAYHTNATNTVSLVGDKGTVTFGSTPMTTGSNTVNIMFEGALESWARRGDQQLGRLAGWQGAKNPSFEPSAMARAQAEAALRIKFSLEQYGRKGVFNLGGGGGEGTSGTVGTWQQRGIGNAGLATTLADGGVEGAGTLGTYGTLLFSQLNKTLQGLWEAKLWNNGPITAVCSASVKAQLTNIFKTEYNFGKFSQDTTQAGVALHSFTTDFGQVDIVMAHDFPTHDLYFLNLDYINLVGRPVPDKGLFFWDNVISNGVAGEGGGYYTEMGIDHGPAAAHARIYGIGSVVVGGQAISNTVT